MNIIDSPYMSDGLTVRYLPEPTASSSFDAVKSAVQGIAKVGANLVSGAVGALGLGGAEVPSEYAGLIELQLQTQKEMMLVSMVSNIEKSKHESQMAAVRNIRVG